MCNVPFLSVPLTKTRGFFIEDYGDVAEFSNSYGNGRDYGNYGGGSHSNFIEDYGDVAEFSNFYGDYDRARGYNNGGNGYSRGEWRERNNLDF